MDHDIQPAADGIFRRVFPCLQSGSPVEVMGGLPIIEDFIAILYGHKSRSEGVDEKKGVEHSNCWHRWFDMRLLLRTLVII